MTINCIEAHQLQIQSHLASELHASVADLMSLYRLLS